MRLILVVGFTLAAGACVPQKNVPIEDIPKLTSLSEVMHLQATVADPQMKKAGSDSFTDADWAAFSDAGARLTASSTKLKDFSKGPEWDQLAMALNGHAQALSDASTAKDVAKAKQALSGMKQVCRDCHKKFR